MKRGLVAVKALIVGLFVLSGSDFMIASPVEAKVIGTMSPPDSLSLDRLKALPPENRAAWQAYLKASDDQRLADKAALAAERVGLAAIPPPAVDGDGAKTMPLNQTLAFYASPEARHVGDVILSFQTPAGAWGKNQPRDGALRQKGQAYVAHDGRGDKANTSPSAESWDYVGTIDNDATLTEIRFLALVAAQAPGAGGDKYRQGAVHGIEYLLRAQYPNGGWPQVWPLDGGYHDAITFNDDAFINTQRLLHDVEAGRPEFAFVPEALRNRTTGAVAAAQACILRTQVRINGVPTLWGQQHDVLTEAPTGARNFEPPALSSTESASVMTYLMSLPDPSPEMVKAVNGAAAFLKASAIMNYAWSRDADPAIGRRLVAKPGAGPLWSRYYALDTQKPIFGDRDRTVHDDVNEISLERRNGYSWFNTSPAKVLAVYDKWAKAHP